MEPVFNYNASLLFKSIEDKVVTVLVSVEPKNNLKKIFCKEFNIWLPVSNIQGNFAIETLIPFVESDRWITGADKNIVDGKFLGKPGIKYQKCSFNNTNEITPGRTLLGFNIEKPGVTSLYGQLEILIEEKIKTETTSDFESAITSLQVVKTNIVPRIDYFIACNKQGYPCCSFRNDEPIEVIARGTMVEFFELWKDGILVKTNQTVGDFLKHKFNPNEINKNTSLIVKAVNIIGDETYQTMSLNVDSVDNNDLTINNKNILLNRSHESANNKTWEQSIVFRDEVQRTGAKISGNREKWDGAPMGLSFYTGACNTIAERLTIKSDGNIGIGITEPQSKLHVEGDVKISGGLYFWKFGGGAGWSKVVASTWLALDHSLSDKRLKRDIHPLKNALKKVLGLNAVLFNWNKQGLEQFTSDVEKNNISESGTNEDNKKLWDTEKQKILKEKSGTKRGFIAQEVQEVFPEWVQENEGGYKTINISELNVVLAQAIKELKEEKDAEIALLKTEVKELKLQIEDLTVIINKIL